MRKLLNEPKVVRDFALLAGPERRTLLDEQGHTGVAALVVSRADPGGVEGAAVGTGLGTDDEPFKVAETVARPLEFHRAESGLVRDESTPRHSGELRQERDGRALIA